MDKEYGVYSKFNLYKHAETFINYLEVIIDSRGEVYYAVPSHQMFMENLIKRRWGEQEFHKMVECPEAYNDYLIWLCKTTGCIPVWNEFYLGEPNEAQLETLNILKSTKYTKIDLPIYQGKV